MKHRLRTLACIATILGCGSSSAPVTGVEPLDPKKPHYGKTYAEWAAAWVEWVYQWPEGAAASDGGVTADDGGSTACDGGPPPGCVDPVADTTGALCAFAQDPNSPVFFLAGDWGGVVRRASCIAPAGKALFLPVVVGVFQDNGGVPVTMLKTDPQLMASAAAELQPVSQVLFSVDGHSVSLQSYAVVAAHYQYVLPPEPNIFTCQGSPGVTGTYSGYTSGYFVLLPPLAPGPHTIALSAKVDMTPTSAAFALDVRYDPLTIR
jgi:hypothetical protein